jgi:hypothetical protein
VALRHNRKQATEADVGFCAKHLKQGGSALQNTVLVPNSIADGVLQMGEVAPNKVQKTLPGGGGGGAREPQVHPKPGVINLF